MDLLRICIGLTGVCGRALDHRRCRLECWFSSNLSLFGPSLCCHFDTATSVSRFRFRFPSKFRRLCYDALNCSGFASLKRTLKVIPPIVLILPALLFRVPNPATSLILPALFFRVPVSATSNFCYLFFPSVSFLSFSPSLSASPSLISPPCSSP